MRTAWLKSPRLLAAVVFNVAYLCLSGVGGASDAPADDDAFGASGSLVQYSLRAPEGATPRVASYYSPEVNQTSVYPAEDLILVGGAGRRLLLSPIISWTGERSSAPKSVHFRFYSFADVSQYDTARGLRVTADGEELWEAAAPIYSITFGHADRVVENLGAQVPFEVLARATAAETMKVAVGREEIELTAEQVNALRLMLRCAQAGACS